MLRDIIFKEIYEVITSPKFICTFVLCTILILLSVFMRISDYRADIREYANAVALNRKELESRTSYIDIASFGIKVLKRPSGDIQ